MTDDDSRKLQKFVEAAKELLDEHQLEVKQFQFFKGKRAVIIGVK